jgi:two-component system cell cycle sensor histidine kinase/response regulator CckA
MVDPEIQEGSILLVDDDKDVREFLGQVLLTEGYSVIQASSGHQAWERFVQNQDDFDLVITDIVMPGLLGSDLAARILEIKPFMKFLFISGNAPPKSTLEMIEGKNFLSKPFKVSELFDAIQHVLTGR